MPDAVHALIDAAPKAELHLHIEGTLEPSMMLSLAERHGAALPWDTLDHVRASDTRDAGTRPSCDGEF